jgi:hypothetical protein
MAAFFASEAVDKSIPASRGIYLYPGEAEAYESQYNHLARKCYVWAREAEPDNPLLGRLASYLDEKGSLQ